MYKLNKNNLKRVYSFLLLAFFFGGASFVNAEILYVPGEVVGEDFKKEAAEFNGFHTITKDDITINYLLNEKSEVLFIQYIVGESVSEKIKKKLESKLSKVLKQNVKFSPTNHFGIVFTSGLYKGDKSFVIKFSKNYSGPIIYQVAFKGEVQKLYKRSVKSNQTHPSK